MFIPCSSELEFLIAKIWDCRGCVCGPNFVCGSELWTAAVETEKQEVEGAPYKASVTEGRLEEKAVGYGEP